MRSLILLLLFALIGVGRAAHWAYVPPVPSAAPVDELIAAEHARQGLCFSPPAAPATLLRRMYLDLTGLPPTPGEVARFLENPSPAAYAAAVERLLASPAYGEHWATMWLDLARYADSQGYEKDNLRVTWAYRDWVIAAFNRDLPFDQFTREQLAGDLLPQATHDQRVATAFHRQTMTNTEGGSDDEEFRLKAVVDRTNTTATVWLGLTLGCAQCHEHPSEAISARDYFQFLAFFNNTEDADRDDDAPLLNVQPLTYRAEAERLRRHLAQHPQDADARRELEALPNTTVPVLQELPPHASRSTHRWRRGGWLSPAERVTPGALNMLAPWPAGAPRNRLGLAQWLVQPGHPLTARVMVNRLWARLFGRGFVLTEEDFGTTGAKPVHTAVLDALAHRFAHAHGWSIKAVLREIVLSRTYQQGSAATPAAVQADPDNQWLARGARFRLPAETIRDQAIAAAGLLSRNLYGPSVMPPQPEGVWQVVYNVQRWVPSRGENRYRRALYTFRRKSSPFPGLTLLDAPARDTCTPRRGRTNTPTAALALLNDPIYHEAASTLARRMLQEGGASEAERLRFGWALLLAEAPAEPVVARLHALLHTARVEAGNEEAAYTTVALAILNLDRTLSHE